jgi:hypothetical protein
MLSCILIAGALSFGVLSLEPVAAELRAGRCAEFRVVGVGEPSGNPFDPGVIVLDAVFTDPAGKTVRIPAFWMQDFTRSLVDGAEKLQPQGEPGWRVRYTPWVSGTHQCELLLGQDSATPSSAGGSTVEVLAAQSPARGHIRVEPEKKRFFEYGDGTPMPLLGSNLCWPGGRGTYDYDDWLPAFAGAGMNFSRLWMWPLAFGIEVLPGERLNYNQSQAWRLDHVMGLAADKGVQVMLCIDYHGVFQDEKDMWGGNDYWPTHPYNQTQGGPCAVQNDFFTNPDARKLYEKRLRYLVGRYGAYPSLFCWEFFNEINNVYFKLKRNDVVQWHADMAGVLHAMDPFRHPVTTSFGGVFEDRKMWEVPALDFTQYHLYCDDVRKGLGVYIAETAQRFSGRYGRPMVIGEFGTTYKNDGRAIDPNDWCLRQGLWTGMLTGTAGTVVPWWWEGLQSANRYPLWLSLSNFIKDTGFGGPAWHPAETVTPPQSAPAAGPLAPEPGAAPFTAELRIDSSWNEKPAGELMLRGPEDADAPPLPAYLHGTAHERMRLPFRIQALFAEGASVRVQVDAVSDGAKVAVRVDGATVAERDIPNKDGKHEVNGEYTDLFIEAPVPPGAHTVELVNTGGDWAHVCAVRLSNAVSALGRGANQGADAFAMTDGSAALLYLVDRRYAYPRGRSATAPQSCETTLTLKGLADGDYAVAWWDPLTGTATGSGTVACQNGALELATPPFRVDAAARILPAKKP